MEAVHRLKKRYRLEEDLQTQEKQNLTLMVNDNQYFDATRPWRIQFRSKVQEMRKGAEKAAMGCKSDRDALWPRYVTLMLGRLVLNPHG